MSDQFGMLNSSSGTDMATKKQYLAKLKMFASDAKSHSNLAGM